MKPKSHCTIRDVAVDLGVSAATVSRALHNDPRITEDMRLKVVKTAARLGYRRDPKLSELMSHVRATKARAFQGTLAWITDYDLNVPEEREAYELSWGHAERRALELGYVLKCFPNSRSADSLRIDRQLHAQGIQGIVIQQFKETFHLPDWHIKWRRFAIVHNGACQTPFSLDNVDADDVANCVNVFEKLTALGYRRIGICTTEAIERANNYSLNAAQKRFCLRHPEVVNIPACLLPDMGEASSQKVVRWMKQHRVDGVISQVRGMKELLESTGKRVPGDIGLVWQGVNPNHTCSGMWQREDIIASVIMETLIASVEQGRKGLPAAPRVTLIQGTWHEGVTCRRKGEAIRVDEHHTA